MFYPIKKSLHKISLFINIFVVATLIRAVLSWWYDGLHTAAKSSNAFSYCVSMGKNALGALSKRCQDAARIVSGRAVFSNRSLALLVLLGLSTTTLAQNSTDPDVIALVDQYQLNLNQCLYNNTELLNEIAQNTLRIPQLGEQNLALYYTIVGAWVSMAGIGVTFFCDSCSSWYFSKKSEEVLSAQLIGAERTILDEIRRNNPDDVQRKLSQYQILLLSSLLDNADDIDQQETMETINAYLDENESDKIDLQALRARIQLASKTHSKNRLTKVVADDHESDE